MEASGRSPPNSQSIPPKSSSSLPMKSFFNSLYTITKPQKKLKATHNAFIWRWICFYPARPENTGESVYHQYETTNLRNTTVASKKVKDFTRRLLFCSNLYDTSGMIHGWRNLFQSGGAQMEIQKIIENFCGFDWQF